MNNIGFKDVMYVYAAESASDPTNLKVNIPEVFLDKPVGKEQSTKISFTTHRLFINSTAPAISNFATKYNFITIKVGTSLGTVQLGDKLIATFINGNPNNGIIIARCN